METQNERLRALLTEARTVIHQVIYNDTLQDWACESVEDEPSMEDILRDMRGRIDATLSEPPSPVETEYARLDVMWQTLVRERDEARALRAESDRVLASGVVVSTEKYAELVRAAGPNVSFLDELRLANERAETAQRERDHFKAMLRERAEELLAAREEIERLKALGAVQSADIQRLASRVAQGESDWAALRAEAATAYRRGAEAMREAAARFFADQQLYLNAKDIKNLPIPEDTP